VLHVLAIYETTFQPTSGMGWDFKLIVLDEYSSLLAWSVKFCHFFALHIRPC